MSLSLLQYIDLKGHCSSALWTAPLMLQHPLVVRIRYYRLRSTVSQSFPFKFPLHLTCDLLTNKSLPGRRFSIFNAEYIRSTLCTVKIDYWKCCPIPTTYHEGCTPTFPPPVYTAYAHRTKLSSSTPVLLLDARRILQLWEFRSSVRGTIASNVHDDHNAHQFRSLPWFVHCRASRISCPTFLRQQLLHVSVGRQQVLDSTVQNIIFVVSGWAHTYSCLTSHKPIVD